MGILTLSLMSGGVSATHEDHNLGPTLKVSPEFCITSAEDNVCELTLVLEWENELFNPICIVSDYKEMEKWCAESPETHSFTFSISTTDDIQFIMIDKATRQTLAGVKLKITPPAEPKLRRRYRNPWSLF